ncbi:hypothetical protein DPMN_086326 [Dreissena polymorpha]|uniref:Uncharacterized protein n=1 Tax=Dreissena polymorpha TaxID=45954 RepID=A0A9D4KQZ2_DREPO|nr:hypothetical protein DPMN_086326 [Dreissena polymorpha]
MGEHSWTERNQSGVTRGLGRAQKGMPWELMLERTENCKTGQSITAHFTFVHLFI